MARRYIPNVDGQLNKKVTVSGTVRILAGSVPSRKVIIVTLVVLAVVGGFLRLRLTFDALESPNVYRKDFLQEYLLARSIVEGVNPYLPVSTLAQMFIKDLPFPVLPHPTPHPPPAGVLSAPLGFLSYATAAKVWLGFELICLTGAVWLLLISMRLSPSPGVILAVSLAAIALAPVWSGLVLGQLMILLLFLFCAAWMALKQGKDYAAGAFLGLAAAFKLIGLPILIFLVIRRKWRVVLGTVAAGGIANGVAVLLMGFGPVIEYYSSVSRIMFPLYRSASPNISVWTLGWRLFDGTGSPVIVAFRAPPLLQSSFLASAVSIAAPIVLITLGVVFALRTRSEDIAFAMLVCVSILFQPVAWSHYLVLMGIPMTLALRRLWERGFPGGECILLLCLTVLLGLPGEQLDAVQGAFATKLLPHQELLIPFPAALFSLIYTAAVLAMLWFLWHLDRADEPVRDALPNVKELAADYADFG